MTERTDITPILVDEERRAILEAAARERERERVLVEELGQQIGYGRLMQLAERIWDWQQPGAAHSVGPCTSMLVPCPHPPHDLDANGHCPWCCGSGRVTRRVLHAIQGQPCEHDFGGWREHADGRGGEQFCRKCGMGAMEHTLRNDPT